jgi:hypothetical protein
MIKSALTITLLSILSSGLMAPVSAQTNNQNQDLSDQIIVGAWGDPAKCNSSNARPLSLTDAARGDGVSPGDCVAVTGYWAGRALFASLADANAKRSTTSDALEGRRVGIYAKERLFATAPRRPKPFKIVGVYASCKTEWPEAMMVLGYCHFSDGPFLKAAQATAARRSDVR